MYPCKVVWQTLVWGPYHISRADCLCKCKCLYFYQQTWILKCSLLPCITGSVQSQMTICNCSIFCTLLTTDKEQRSSPKCCFCKRRSSDAYCSKQWPQLSINVWSSWSCLKPKELHLLLKHTLPAVFPVSKDFNLQPILSGCQPVHVSKDECKPRERVP